MKLTEAHRGPLAMESTVCALVKTIPGNTIGLIDQLASRERSSQRHGKFVAASLGERFCLHGPKNHALGQPRDSGAESSVCTGGRPAIVQRWDRLRHEILWWWHCLLKKSDVEVTDATDVSPVRLNLSHVPGQQAHGS